MAGRADLGPDLPPRLQVHGKARELEALAKRAAEFSGTGPTRNLQLALKQFDAMRVILSVPQAPGAGHPPDLASGAGAPAAGRPCGPADRGTGDQASQDSAPAADQAAASATARPQAPRSSIGNSAGDQGPDGPRSSNNA